MRLFNEWMLGTLIVMALLLATASVAFAGGEHIKTQLQPVGGSGVSGTVNVKEFPKERGAHINVNATGLVPGETYVSLYYDNHTCDLEPYSEEDVIGGPYVADADGNGATAGKADDEIDEVNSVSVRLASDFTLLACADLHP
jgi:hypothetical protein